MIGKTLWNEFFTNRDWPVSSAVAVILLLLLVVPIVLFQHAQAQRQEAGPMNAQLEPLQHHLDRARLRLPLPADRAPGHLLASTTRSWSRSGAASRPSGTARCSTTRA